MITDSTIQAEQSVIASLMIAPDKFDEISETISEKDFYRLEHQLIFRHITRLIEKGKQVDVITVAESIESTGKLDKVGGLHYLGELVQGIASSANIKSYAKIVNKQRRERDFLAAIVDLNEIAESHGDLSEKIENASNILNALADNRRDSIVTWREAASKALEGIEKRFQSGGEIHGLKTGLIDFDKKTGGLHPGDLIILAGRPSMGKELTLNSKVLLSSGEFKRMGDIKMNDKVASIDGNESVVTGVFPQGIKPVYRIMFSDGRYVDAGLEHQWEVMYRDWNSEKVVTTSWLIEKLKCNRYKNRLYIPYPSGDFGVDKDIIIHPYLLGVLLGDGCFTQGSIKLSTSFEYLKEKITPHLMGAELIPSGGIDYRLSTKKGSEKKLLDAIKSLGLMGKYSHEKFIPDQYLSASKETRIELLRGLIDTDGTVEKTGSMTYTTTSERMGREIQSLARSLGAFASISSRVTKYSYSGEIRNGKKSYRICISNKNCSEFVTIPHKLERVKEKSRERKLSISSIEYIGDDECQCISVSHNRSLYLTDEYTATHNTALSMNIAENVALDNNPVLVFSLEMSDEQLAVRSYASIGNIDLNVLRSAAIKDDDWSKLTYAIGKISDSPLFIDPNPMNTASQMHIRARKIKRQHGLSLIVIDYLQLMTESSQGESRVQEISSITRKLKLMAKDLHVPVICLSQLSRKVEERADKRPMMSDLRESGAIEQDADMIVMMYRDDYYHKDSPNKGIAEANIVKQRMGETGTVMLTFMGQYSKFTSFSGNYVPYAEKAKKRGMD